MSNGSNATSKKEKDIEKLQLHEEQVRLSAYYSWKSKGEKHGEDMADWFEAEESL